MSIWHWLIYISSVRIPFWSQGGLMTVGIKRGFSILDIHCPKTSKLVSNIMWSNLVLLETGYSDSHGDTFAPRHGNSMLSTPADFLIECGLCFHGTRDGSQRTRASPSDRSSPIFNQTCRFMLGMELAHITYILSVCHLIPFFLPLHSVVYLEHGLKTLRWIVRVDSPVIVVGVSIKFPFLEI